MQHLVSKLLYNGMAICTLVIQCIAWPISNEMVSMLSHAGNMKGMFVLDLLRMQYIWLWFEFEDALVLFLFGFLFAALFGFLNLRIKI